MQKTNKTLPHLQKKLNYTGPDSVFKQYVLSALENRGSLHSMAFRMYYGIDCPKCKPEKIAEELSVYNVNHIKNMVMELIQPEIKAMMEEAK